MEFRLLGAVEAFDGDVPVDLGSPKQRLVAAVLAFTPGRAVPIQVLIDRVWDDAASTDVRSSVHGYISRLRRVLGPGSPIARRPAGYVLQIDPAHVDVVRFQELVADGKRRAEAEAEVAVERLREAIALWRGVPLADLSGSWVERTRASLEQQRLEALVGLGELELSGGRHRESVRMLSSWTEEYPLSEPLAGLLMRALVRLGRRAEALAHFAHVREHLVAELGEEPGRELQRLHERILQRDPTLEVPEQRPDETPAVVREPSGERAYAAAELMAPVPRPRPAELPAAVPTFVGRLEEMSTLCGRLTQTSGNAIPVVAVAGAAGTGKSALAVRAAHAVADKFPDGALYANLHGSTPGRSPADPVDVLAQFLRSQGYALDQVPATLEDATVRFRSAMAERRLLIVLDDAASAAQVRPLIPTGPGSAVLVTSRRVLGALDAATHLHLRPMSEPDSCDLLAAMVSTNQAEASPGSVRALRNVVELCGRLPLAVRIAAARLAAHPEWDLDTLGGRLSDARQRLNELQYADLDIRASFAMSTAGLEPGPLRLFEQLGLLDLDHISVPLAATIEGKPQHTDPSRLDALIEAQLLSTAGQDRYAFHDLIRIYARELAGADLDRAQQDETIQRAHHHYLATIRNAAAILTPATEPRLSMGIPPAQIHVEGLSFESRTEAAQWVDTEAANLLATARQAAGTSAGQPVVVALSAAAAGPFYTRRHIRTLTHLAQLAIEAADACGNEPGLAQAHSDLALGYLAVDRIEDALEHTELALRAWTQAGDLSYQAGTLNNIGILWQRLGDTDLALDYFRRSRDIRGQLGHTQAQAAVLANMADAFAERTEYPAAVAHLEEARTLYRLAGHPGGEGYALGSLGIVYLKAGEPARARTCLERALQLVDRAALRHFAEFCWYLGAAHHALGDSEQAQDFRRQALDCLQETGVLSAVEAQAILADPSPATPQPFR